MNHTILQNVVFIATDEVKTNGVLISLEEVAMVI